MKLNEKQKLTAVISVLGVALIGLGTLTFFKFKERLDLLETMENHVKKERLARDKINLIPSLREERDRLAATVEEYAQILPKDEHVQHDAFVDTVDSFRKDTDIVIRRASYIDAPAPAAPAPGAAPPKAQRFTRHRYKFELVGTVPHLIAFINKIENHTRFLKVDALSIRPFGAPKNAGNFDAANPEVELERANEKLKEFELTVSTYTYAKET